MLHIVILVAWYICNPSQQRLDWYYSSSSTAVVPLLLLWNAILLVYSTLWITPNHPSQRPLPFPPLRPRMDMFLVLATRIYSYQQGITRTQLPFYAPEILPCSLIRSTTNHGFPDFPAQQYSYFLFSILGTSYYLFPRGCQAFHNIYILRVDRVYYIIPYALGYFNFIHTEYIYF